jgi:hypothetical protein
MEKEFVPYKLALRMKQIGFDNVPCLAIWYNIPELDNYEFFDFSNHFSYQHYETQYSANKAFKDAILCPLYQQAFRWFRDKYGYEIIIKEFIFIIQYHKKTKLYSVINHFESKQGELSCLEKCIEIVEQSKLKKKNNGKSNLD